MPLPSYLQDDDDDEDDDFIPGVDDEDEECSSDDDDESEADKDDIPPFLQGYLMADPTNNRTIIFEEKGVFCLKSESEIPRDWSIWSPLLSKPVSFVGWIGDPTKCIEFQVQVLQQDSLDEMDEKFLQAQHEKMKSQSEEENKTVAFPASTNQDQKKVTLQVKCPQAQPPMLKSTTPFGNSNLVTYSMAGTGFHGSHEVTFRGLFCPLTSEECDISSQFIICTTKVERQGEYSGATTSASRGSANAAVSK